jgi:hypothetical protein
MANRIFDVVQRKLELFSYGELTWRVGRWMGQGFIRHILRREYGSFRSTTPPIHTCHLLFT